MVTRAGGAIATAIPEKRDRRRSATIRLLSRAVSVFACWFCCFGAARANNGLQLIGTGPKANGRGGVETAVADSALSAGRNPALLMALERKRVDGALLWLYERTRTRTDTEQRLDNVGTPVPFPSVWFAWDPAAPARDDPAWDRYEGGEVRLGFGLHMPAALVFAPSAALAWRASSTLSLGGSLNVVMTYLKFDTDGGSLGGSGGATDYVPRGDVTIYYQPDGTPVVPPQPFDAGTGEQVSWAEVWQAVSQGVSGPPPPNAPKKKQPRVILSIDGAFGVGLQGQFGALWTPREDLAFGIALRTPGIIFRPRGRGRLDFDEAIATLNEDPGVQLLLGGLIDTYVPDRGRNGFASDYRVETKRLVLPPEVSLGVAWWPLERWMVGADVRWIGWDMALNKISLHASGGKNADINEIAGGPTIDYDLKLFWRDQFVFALGTALALRPDLVVRLGYNYGNNPVPQRTMAASSLVIEHHLTLGASMELGRWNVDFAYIWGIPKQGTIESARTRFKTELHVVQIGFGYQW